MQLTVRPDLTVTLGREATRLSAAEGFEAAQILIRAATRRLVQEEMGLVDTQAPSSSPAGNRVEEAEDARDAVLDTLPRATRCATRRVICTTRPVPG
jgi:hypothetical protein